MKLFKILSLVGFACTVNYAVAEDYDPPESKIQACMQINGTTYEATRDNCIKHLKCLNTGKNYSKKEIECINTNLPLKK